MISRTPDRMYVPAMIGLRPIESKKKPEQQRAAEVADRERQRVQADAAEPTP
jgi:hypothetical protein